MIGLISSIPLILIPVAFCAKSIEPLKRRVSGETSVEEPTWFCISKLKAEKTWKNFKTPGYPKSLEMKHSRCTWKISAAGKMKIRVAFRGIGLMAEDPAHCSSNYIEIIDEVLGKSQMRLCGRKTSGDIVSQGNKLRIDLQRDPSETLQRGFSISYIATKAKPGFYAKKSFNEKPLPPLKKKKTESKDKEETKKKTKDTKKTDNSGSNSRTILISPDGQLYQGYPKKRQADNNSGFKRLSNSGGSSSGISTLAIIGIVIGALIGVLIIVLIFRKLFLNKRDKEKNGEIVQGNSGLQKINMSHENVLNAKRNILAATVIVNNKEGHHLPKSPDGNHEKRHSWSSSDSDFKTFPPKRQEPKEIAGNPSYRHENFIGNGITNQAYEGGTHHKIMRNNSPSRTPNDRERSRESSSFTRNMLYRYNGNQPAGPQQNMDEVLNSEEFYHYDSAFNPQELQRPAKKPDDKRKRSRSRLSKVNSRNRSSPESDFSDVFKPNLSTRKGKSMESPTRNIRPVKLSERIERKGRPIKGVSKMAHGDKEFSNHIPAKKPRTVKENETKERKGIIAVQEGNKLSKRSKSQIEANNNHFQLSRTTSQFKADPPSPSVPRHVVPSSRR